MGGVTSAPVDETMSRIHDVMEMLAQRVTYLDARAKEQEQEAVQRAAAGNPTAACLERRDCYVQQQRKLADAYFVLMERWADLAIPVMRAGLEARTRAEAQSRVVVEVTG